MVVCTWPCSRRDENFSNLKHYNSHVFDRIMIYGAYTKCVCTMYMYVILDVICPIILFSLIHVLASTVVYCTKCTYCTYTCTCSCFHNSSCGTHNIPSLFSIYMYMYVHVHVYDMNIVLPSTFMLNL